MQFKELGLSDELLSAVKSMGFDEMTEIQEKSIPVIMKGFGHNWPFKYQELEKLLLLVFLL